SIQADRLDNLGSAPEIEQVAISASTAGADGKAGKTVCGAGFEGNTLCAPDNSTGWMRKHGLRGVSDADWQAFIDQFPITKTLSDAPSEVAGPNTGSTWAAPWNDDGHETEELWRFLSASGYREQLKAGSAARPGQILAGRDIKLDGNALHNQYATISAGNDIELTGGSFHNEGRELKQVVDLRYEQWKDPNGLLYSKQHHDERTIGAVGALVSAGHTIRGNLAGSLINGAETGRSPSIVSRRDAATPGGPANVHSGIPTLGQPAPFVPVNLGHGIVLDGAELRIDVASLPTSGLFIAHIGDQLSGTTPLSTSAGTLSISPGQTSSGPLSGSNHSVATGPALTTGVTANQSGPLPGSSRSVATGPALTTGVTTNQSGPLPGSNRPVETGPALTTGPATAQPVAGAEPIQLASPTPAQPDTPPRVAIPSSQPAAPVPSAPGHRYLIETNPQFTDGRRFLSSDYMLERLGLTPDWTHKRLGDGFFEQRLLTQQLLQRTGRQLLAGQTDRESQFRALMEQGVRVARQFDLQAGVRLSAAQMAALTEDMIWLEARQLTLADGRTDTVLVPQLYLAHGERMRLNQDGALMLADNIDLSAGRIVNAGAMEARDRLSLTARDSLANLGGDLRGKQLDLYSGGDLLNQSGLIQGDQLRLQAGGDIRLDSQRQRLHTDAGFQDVLGRIGQLDASQSLSLLAGHDLDILGSDLNAGQSLSLG
ncbi:large exoprotein involved in heme utilization and adhesion, partial [Chitinivorax tropicus]